MAADRGDTAGQGVERVSGVEPVCPCGHSLKEHPHPFPGNAYCECRLSFAEAVDAHVAARLAPVEALADDCQNSRQVTGMDPTIVRRDGTPVDIEAQLRAALSQPTAAPSPDREPEPTPSEES